MKPNVVDKKKSKRKKIADWIVTGIFGSLFVFVLIMMIDGFVNKDKYFGQTLRFGIGTFVVKTDSMKEQYPVGSAIITYREKADKVYEDYQNGKTIDVTFMDIDRVIDFYPSDSTLNEATYPTGFPMTHRVREMHLVEDKEVGEGRYIFVVTGTNNEGELSKMGQFQSFTEKHYLGTVKSSSRFLGGIFQFVTSVWGLFILLLIPACFLIVVSVLDIFKKMKDVPEQAIEGKEIQKPEIEMEGLSKEDKERLKQELLMQMLEDKQKQKQKKEIEKENNKND